LTNQDTSDASEVTITAQATFYKFENLVSATAYSVRIKVTNLIGDSDWSPDYVTAMTGIEPTRPGILTFDASTRTTLDFSWLPLAGQDTGGTAANPLAITFYHLYMDDGFGGDFALLDSKLGTDPTSHTVRFMQSGRTYRFKF
jgi:hypothetical protein